MAIRRTTITVSGTTGGAGVATANTDSSEIVEGEIIAVHLAYQGSPPAGTTDIVLEETTYSPAVRVLAITNAATDGWFFPRASAVTNAGVAITDSAVRIVVADYLNLLIAGANDNDGVIGTVVWDDLMGMGKS